MVFFTSWDILFYPGLKIALGFSAFYTLFHFISNYFIEKSPVYIFELSLFLFSLYFILLIDYFGGPTTYLALWFYIVILGVSLYRILWGVAYTFTFISYLLIFGYFIEGDILINPQRYLIPLFSMIVSVIAGYFINFKNQQIRRESEELKKVADKLTAGKISRRSRLNFNC
jgi:hypothetical protein